MYTLYGCRGCGSTAIEALLELSQVPYRSIVLDWDRREQWEQLRPWNPLLQVPTLVTDGGLVMSESIAIALWLAESNPALAPPDAAARAAFYRWMVFIPANIYAAIGAGDFPERWVEANAAASLKEKSRGRVEAYWQMMENALDPAPYLLGATMSALDVCVAMVSRWRPGRPWIEANCPKISGAATLTEQHPAVARVWARNFGP